MIEQQMKCMHVRTTYDDVVVYALLTYIYIICRIYVDVVVVKTLEPASGFFQSPVSSASSSLVLQKIRVRIFSARLELRIEAGTRNKLVNQKNPHSSHFHLFHIVYAEQSKLARASMYAACICICVCALSLYSKYQNIILFAIWSL